MKCTILNSTVKLTDLPHTVRFLWKKQCLSSSVRDIW